MNEKPMRYALFFLRVSIKNSNPQFKISAACLCVEGFKSELRVVLRQNNEFAIRWEHVILKYISKFTLDTNRLFTSTIAILYIIKLLCNLNCPTCTVYYFWSVFPLWQEFILLIITCSWCIKPVLKYVHVPCRIEMWSKITKYFKCENKYNSHISDSEIPFNHKLHRYWESRE